MSVETHERRAETAARPDTRRYVWSAPTRKPGRRMHGAVVFLIAVALIGAVGMLYLLQTAHVANLGYEMSRLQGERQAALVEQQELSARIAEKQALTSVESTARQELGMRPIGDYIFLDVELPPAEATAAPEPPAPKPSALERFWGRLTGQSDRSAEADEGAGDD